MAEFRSPYIVNLFTPNLAAPNESRWIIYTLPVLRSEKGIWLPCGIQDLYSKYKILGVIHASELLVYGARDSFPIPLYIISAHRQRVAVRMQVSPGLHPSVRSAQSNSPPPPNCLTVTPLPSACHSEKSIKLDQY